MTFVNEKLTAEQRKEFAKREIKHPHNPTKLLVPYFWTIDHFTDTCLISAGEYHDLPEEIFLFLSLKSRFFV
jgi:hypothetical protein